MAVSILETRGLVREFGRFRAVDGVDLRIAEGTIHGLIGPNGAGKTTCFNLLSKFLEPTEGTIRFLGRDITGLRPAEVARLGLVRSFQISAVFSHLSVLDNLRIALARTKGISPYSFWHSERALRMHDERARALLADIGLGEEEEAIAATLPYGQKRALELATTLALEPRMLLLDEPTSGMGYEEVERIVALIRRVQRGRTILMVEHNLSVVAGLCHTITVLTRGRVLAEGDYAAMAQHPEVISAYLGVEHA
ncbi:MAG: ABC transporter ATP-binding protein [Acetobacteraceae bacterium]